MKKTISTMKPLVGQTAGAATVLVINNEGYLPNLLRLEGFCNGTANTQYFLQFFAATAAPAANTKPIHEVMMLGVNGFTYNYQPDGLDLARTTTPASATGNLIAVVSTVSGSYTASAITFTLEATVEIANIAVTGLSVAGDLTTAVQTLQVWADASGPKTLFEIRAQNNSGTATQYLMLFSKDTPVTGDIPLEFWTFTDTQSRMLHFGANGYSPMTQTAAVPPVVQDACQLFVSSTAGTYTAASGTPWTIRATYK